jgi:hypothetical protein
MVSWLVRFARVRRLDRNPLRRATDRLETALLAALIIAFAAGTPFAALSVGAWVHAHAQREQRAQVASERRVPAVVRYVVQPTTGDLANDVLVSARWTAPDGEPVTADVFGPSGIAAGDTVPVWITRDGLVANPPLRDSQISGQAELAVAGSAVAGVLLLSIACVATCQVLDRRRMASWAAEWQEADPLTHPTGQ